MLCGLLSNCGIGGVSLVVVLQVLIAEASFVVGRGLEAAWASVVAARGLYRAQAQWLWHMGLVAPWHAGSSQTRDRTRVFCIGRRILYH